MTDPVKALADAARDALLYFVPIQRTHPMAHSARESLASALAAYDAAQVSQPPTDAELESAIDAYRDACYAHARAATFGEDDDEPSTAQAAHDARKALSSLMRARPDAGLLRTEFGISSYPVPSKASDGWPDNFSVWRLKDGRTRIYRQAVAPTDAEVEGCNATELREALFNRNNDVERLVEQRDGLLRAAKELLANIDEFSSECTTRYETTQEDTDTLRAEVARVDGK